MRASRWIVVSLPDVIELLATEAWQMTFGERAALEGVLAQLQPTLSIEIGTAEGGSLRRIAAHSGEVHSFDLVQPDASIEKLSNVTLHTGDSHVLLAEFLEELARAERVVDFALVDGDHTAEGVRRDLDALLASPAVKRSVILIHDTANEIVRDGLERVRYADYPMVSFHDLDFVSGHLSDGGPFHHQLWGGLGLVVVDGSSAVRGGDNALRPGFYSSFELFAAMRSALTSAERAGRATSPREVVQRRDGREQELSADLDRTRTELHSVIGSTSWRGTAPLRKLRRRLRERGRRPQAR